MALTWNVADIVNHEDVTTAPRLRPEDADKWHPVTEALIWHSMICGFNKITRANWEEVYARVRMWEHVAGCMLANDEGDIPITKVDVERHIGLHTNTSTMSNKDFTAKVMNEVAKQAKLAENTMPAHLVIEDRINRARAQLED